VPDDLTDQIQQAALLSVGSATGAVLGRPGAEENDDGEVEVEAHLCSPRGDGGEGVGVLVHVLGVDLEDFGAGFGKPV